MGATSIQWTDFSINPIRARIGNGSGHYCEKVSPGCKNCYSSRLQPRFRMPQFQDQRRADVVHFFDESKLAEVLRRRKPTKYFWCDMSDMFGDWVPNEWIAACFGVMAATPHHTHQVLTKRSKRMREWFAWATATARERDLDVIDVVLSFTSDPTTNLLRAEIGDDGEHWPLPHVWLGVSAEDQQRADERIPDLLATPAAVRFVSAEPLIGPMDLSRVRPDPMPIDALTGRWSVPARDGSTQEPRLHWVIVGGESGHGARPCDVDWIASIVQQCRDAGVACFVKQLGAIAMGDSGHVQLRHRKGGDPSEWPADLRVREFPR
jgi:protein gp37